MSEEEYNPTDTARKWLAALQLAKREDEKWLKRGKKIVRRYRDERQGYSDNKKRYNKAIRHGKQMWLVHRLLWVKATGQNIKGKELDHIDGDKLNNSVSNLRVVTRTQNMQNQHRASKASRTGVKGVGFYHGKYRARIGVDGKLKELGVFKTIEEAKAAYEAAAKRYHTHNPSGAVDHG